MGLFYRPDHHGFRVHQPYVLDRDMGNRVRSRPRPIGAPGRHRHLAVRVVDHLLQPLHRQDRLQGGDAVLVFRVRDLVDRCGRGVLHLRRRQRQPGTGLQDGLLGQPAAGSVQRHSRGVHQPRRRHDVQQRQDQMVEHPSRRLARRAGDRRLHHHRDGRRQRVLAHQDRNDHRAGDRLRHHARPASVPRAGTRGLGHHLQRDAFGVRYPRRRDRRVPGHPAADGLLPHRQLDPFSCASAWRS